MLFRLPIYTIFTLSEVGNVLAIVTIPFFSLMRFTDGATSRSSAIRDKPVILAVVSVLALVQLGIGLLMIFVKNGWKGWIHRRKAIEFLGASAKLKIELLASCYFISAHESLTVI